MKQLFSCITFFWVILVSNVNGQTITTGIINGSPFCPGGRVTVNYTITGTFNANNIFRAQLSDANGNFGSAPTVIGSLTSRVAGTITATLPTNVAPGSLYKIRVVSTNRVITGTPSISAIQIKSSIACSLTGASIDDLNDVVVSSPTSGQSLIFNGSNWVNENSSGSGTVTTVSVSPSNGFAGTVNNSSTTPVISLSTTVNGILKGNGTSISAAISGTDFAAANHTHSIAEISNLQASLDEKVNGWSLTGNAGLDENLNFIGTTDDKDLSFKVYNVLSGKISSKSNNTSWGRYGLIANTTGYGNTANGFKALHSNTSGNENTAFGLEALGSNTTGFNNTAIGANSLSYNTTGYENTSVGKRSLYNNISGTGNSAIGVSSLFSNTTGRHNIALGNAALNLNTEGNENIAIGVQALYNNSTGFFNTAIGANSMLDNTTGYENVAIGKSSMIHNQTGSGNTALGVESLYTNTIGRANFAIGGAAVKNNTEGIENTGVGSESLFHNNTGNNNTAMGNRSLFSNTSGRENVAIGSFALSTNTTGFNNIAIGFKSLEASQTSEGNVAVGGNAIRSNSTGNFNTSIGYQSLNANSTGSENVSHGYFALQSNTTGSRNIAVGPYALGTNQSGNSNTAIGYASDVSSDNLTNATAIGSGAIVNASNKLRLGNTDVTVIEGQVAMTTSDGRFKNNVKEDVPGLSFIMKLKPVTYNFKYNNFSEFLKEKSSNKEHLIEKESQKEMGLIAQDVEKATKELGLNISNLVHVPESDNDNYALSYGQLVVPLIKAIQEQQKTILDLKKLVEEQGKKLESLTSQTGSNQTAGNSENIIIVEDVKSSVILGQNIPNPFENRIIIPFRLPTDCNKATIVITNIANGNIIKAIPISNKETQLNIDVSNLTSGSYNYTLYINGKAIETKKMIKAR